MRPEEPTAPKRSRIGPVRRPSPDDGDGLLEICTRLAVSGSEPPEIARGILDELRAALGADDALLLLDGAGEAVVSGTEIPGTAARQVARAAEATGHPVLVADLATDGRLPRVAASELGALGLRSYLCVPLPAPGRRPGTLHLAAREAERFSSPEVLAAAQAARVLSLVVQAQLGRTEMERHADERAREVAVLLEMSRALGDLTGPGEIPALVLEHLRRVADPDLGAILIVEGGHVDLTQQEELPLPADLRREARTSSLEQLRRRCGGLPEDVRVHELRSGSGMLAGAVAPAWRSELHQVLRSRGRDIGLLSVFDTRPGAFREAQRRLLTTVAGLVSLTLDRFARAREDERSRLQSVVEAMGEGLLWVGADGGLELVNPAGRRTLLDLAGDAAPDRLDRLGQVDLASLRAEFAAGRRVRFQTEVGEGGAGRAYLLTASPVTGAGGESQGMVLVLSDVTDQRQLQEKLIQAERLSSLGEMISGVAHELNNPLAAVMGFAQLLDAGGGLEPDVRKKVRGINEQAARCRRIVQNLLSFARPPHAERAPVDLNGVVRAVIDLLDHQLRVEGVQVDLSLSTDLQAVLGEVHELQQVLLNLVMNAQHAMQEASREGRLRIATEVIGGSVQLTVEDNGVGIPATHLHRVFDPFFTTKAVGKGTGLGLSLAYGCVTDHGGEIDVQSRPGEGTRFVIRLPAHGACPPASGHADAAVAPRPPRRFGGGRHILVVDDEPPVAEFLALALRADGHHVDVAHDGGEAREAIRRERFDLIITDLRMPRMGGRELYEELARTDPETASRFLFSTGDTVSRETGQFLSRFGGRHLTKPFRLDELHELVDRALGDDPS